MNHGVNHRLLRLHSSLTRDRCGQCGLSRVIRIRIPHNEVRSACSERLRARNMVRNPPKFAHKSGRLNLSFYSMKYVGVNHRLYSFFSASPCGRSGPPRVRRIYMLRQEANNTCEEL